MKFSIHLLILLLGSLLFSGNVLSLPVEVSTRFSDVDTKILAQDLDAMTYFLLFGE